MKTTIKHAKEWHFAGDYPKPDSEIYLLVEEDCFTPTEPLLLDGYFRIQDEKPQFCIVEEDGTYNFWTLRGGHSLYMWRYKQQVTESWSETG